MSDSPMVEKMSPKGDASMFKWICLLVAVVALSAFGWMLNDIRLEVRRVADKADQQLPKILTQVEQVTGQLDQRLPKILTEAEQIGSTTNKQLPSLLARTEAAVDNLAALSEDMRHYQGLLGTVHAAAQDKDLLAYGGSLLNLIGGQQAIIGVKKSPTEPKLQQALPAKEWAKASKKQVQFLSVAAGSRAEVLHALTRSKSAAPLFVQLKDQAPRLLFDWIKEMHLVSKDLE